MQRSQRKRCAPSWLKEKPYVKIRFTQDGVITKVTESWMIKLAEDGKELDGSLANFSFRVDQEVWCYWKTINEREKKYFEGKVIEVWDDSAIVSESLQSEVGDEGNSDEELSDVVELEGKINFTPRSAYFTSGTNTKGALIHKVQG